MFYHTANVVQLLCWVLTHVYNGRDKEKFKFQFWLKTNLLFRQYALKILSSSSIACSLLREMYFRYKALNHFLKLRYWSSTSRSVQRLYLENETQVLFDYRREIPWNKNRKKWCIQSPLSLTYVYIIQLLPSNW